MLSSSSTLQITEILIRHCVLVSEAHLQAERGLAVFLPFLIGCLISCLPSQWGPNQEGSILCSGESGSGGPGKLGARKGCHRREEESRRVLLQLLAGEKAVMQHEWLRDSGDEEGRMQVPVGRVPSRD